MCSSWSVYWILTMHQTRWTWPVPPRSIHSRWRTNSPSNEISITNQISNTNKYYKNITNSMLQRRQRNKGEDNERCTHTQTQVVRKALLREVTFTSINSRNSRVSLWNLVQVTCLLYLILLLSVSLTKTEAP